jgi:hypothetical protein
MIVLRSFLIPRRQPPELLEAVDQALDPVALAIQRPIERARAPLVDLTRDRHADAAPPQIRPDLPAAVALVADDTPRTQLGPTASCPLDGALFHQLLKHRRFMALAGRQDNRYRLAVAVGAEMDLGAEPALAAPQRFGCWVPFFAPAACWWARTTVAST